MIPRLAELEPIHENTRAFLAELKRAGFRGDVAFDKASRVVGATDNSIYQILPEAIVFPRTTADVATVLRLGQEARFSTLSFTARGGGTGTNGQSLTTSVVVDLARYMRAIGTFDTAAGWIEVEPGVVKDQLNAFLAPHGVFFAPDLSPSSRATIGGMIATDACGQGSRVYGKTSQHVVGLEVVLATGETVWLEDMTDAAADAEIARGSALGRVLAAVLPVVRANRQDFIEKIPRLQRFVTGYHLPRAVDPDSGKVALQWLITGAEGTLGIVTRARIRVTPIPTARRLAVLEFDNFESALASARNLVATDPSAIETIDDRVLDLARKDIIIHSVRDYLPERTPATRAINLVEYEGTDEAACVARVTALIAECEAHKGEAGWPASWSIAKNDTDRDALWNLRKKGVGLLGNTEGKRKPVPFVEDTVVPPERLSEYVRDFRALLEAEGLVYGMFGHVDVGCLHVRPLLDMRDPEDEARLRRISDKVAVLCQRYGGVIWGEHGKGFRSEYSPQIFGDLFDVICTVKGLFDPGNRLNPGKVATPLDRKHELKSIDQPKRGHFDRQVAPADQETFTRALDCNGNGQCFHWDPDHIMCPSAKVTRDRIHTPKGRAGVMREWLRQLGNRGKTLTALKPASGVKRLLAAPRRTANGVARAFGQYDFSHDVHRTMMGCLACKACATQCPVKVDVPAFRADFLAHYYDRYPRRMRDHFIAGLEQSLKLMALMPRTFAWLFRRKLFQGALSRIIGLVDSPPIAAETLKRKLRAKGMTLLDPATLDTRTPTDTKPQLILLQDAFTSYYEPHVVVATIELLKRLGYSVDLAPFFPNGKGLHVKGFVGRFEKLVAKNHLHLQRLAAGGATLVGIDPAVTLTYRDEYAAVIRKGGLGQPVQVVMLQELLATAPLPKDPKVDPKEIQLFGHCTERALHPGSDRQWQAVFSRFGLNAKAKSVGCCGMSGAFGHEREHFAESRGIFEMSWDRYLPQDSETAVAVTGYSCRSQVARFRGTKPKHPVEFLLAQLGPA